MMRHPFWQAVAILVLAFVAIEFGIPLLPGSAVVPASVVLQYMATVTVGVLIYVSDNEERWAQFQEPIHAMLVEPRLKAMRGTLLVAAHSRELPFECFQARQQRLAIVSKASHERILP